MMHGQGFGWMTGLGFGHALAHWLFWIGILLLLVLGVAALIKYLFSNR